ncbi:MAG TPA: hypothetical protein DCE56_09830 [Cyanobacteria bacterium UBA8553]|nr:hypothetical protein [Cyanobacteria bacterium UBA8553]
MEHYITIETERISRNQRVFHSIRFNLDKDIIKKIQQAKETGCHLYISRKLLADLRYYVLIDGENRLQSGLTFYTYYLGNDSEEALMRSVISTDGDIFHQIRSDCLEHPNFCHRLVSAHYWLIAQLLNQLRLGILLRFKLLSWGLSLLITGVIVIPFIEQLMRINPWLLLVPVGMVLLLQRLMQPLLILFLPILRRWALRKLLSSLLSRKLLEKKIAKGILEWLVP